MSKPQPASRQTVNRRLKPRVNLSDPAHITVLGRTGRIDCTVCDISETGAKLQFTNPHLVPGAFKLYIDRFDFVAECIVVWRSDTRIGVIFESQPNF